MRKWRAGGTEGGGGRREECGGRKDWKWAGEKTGGGAKPRLRDEVVVVNKTSRNVKVVRTIAGDRLAATPLVWKTADGRSGGNVLELQCCRTDGETK